jgi:TMEM175 potassium channel family protein
MPSNDASAEPGQTTSLAMTDMQGAITAATGESRDADRLTVYSDSVFAVIVTIMVLQLKAPVSAHLSALLDLWQPMISYVVSYVFIAIIWINHHYLTRLTRSATLPIIWINFVHLFLVSLLPFTTSWMAQTDLAPAPVAVYAALFVCADGAYNVFERRVLRECDMVTDHQRRVAQYRSLSAFALFACAAVVGAFAPWLGFGLVCLALALHLKPDVGTAHGSDRPTGPLRKAQARLVRFRGGAEPWRQRRSSAE